MPLIDFFSCYFCTLFSSSSTSLGKDHILQINVDRKFAPNVDNSGADSLKEADVSSS